MGDVLISSTAVQLMQPEQFPLEDAVLYAILAGENISNAVANITLGGMATKIESMRRYAQDYYVLGLPQGSRDTIFTAPKTDIEAAIADDIGLSYGVELDLYIQDPLTIYYLLLPFLVADRAYVPLTGRITTLPTGLELPLFSSTGVTAVNVVLLNDLSLDLNTTTEVKTATITYVIRTSYIDTAGVPQTDSEEFFTEEYIITGDYNLDANYCIASYYALDSNGIRTGSLQWWFYELSTEVYPALQGTPQIEATANFLPVIPLRRDNVDLTTDDTSELYLTSKKLLKKISLNIDDLATEINANPDIGDIDNAYVAFAINMQTDENIGIWYLGEFFDYLGRGATVNIWDRMNDILTDDDTIQSNIHNIYNADIGENSIEVNEYGFNLKIKYAAIETVFHTGSIGDIGTATKDLYEDTSGWTEVIMGGAEKWIRWDKNVSNAKAIFKLQITIDTYKEIIVYDPQLYNNIYRRYVQITGMNELVDNSENMNFIIPVHYDVVKGMDRLIQNALYQEALVMVFNSFERVKTAWYASRWFRFILMAISVILIVFSAGTSTFIMSFLTAVEAGLMAVLQFVLYAVIASMVIGQIMKLIAKVLGPELMAILSIIMVIVAITNIGNLGSTTMMGKSMPTSDLLLKCSQSMMTAASSEVERQIIEIDEEYDDFQLESAAKDEALAAAQELLEPINLLNYDLLAAQHAQLLQHPISDPEKFYDITIHIGNIGTKVLDIIPEFHSQAVKLPEVNNLAFTNVSYDV